MKALDLKTMIAETDAEDAEVMAFFRNRRDRIDNLVLLIDGKEMSLVSKDDIARDKKKAEDSARFIVNAGLVALLVGCLVLTVSGCISFLTISPVISAAMFGAVAVNK